MMRAYVRKELIVTLSMMLSAHKPLWGRKGGRVELSDLLDQLSDMASVVSRLIKEEGGANQQLLEPLDRYSKSVCRLKLYIDRGGWDSVSLEQMDQSLQLLQKRLEKEPVTVKIAFLPYKYAMWDSMESIWEAAVSDPFCQCQVVPIPYYEIDERNQPKTKRYEGSLFSPDVRIIDYQTYDLAAEKPDIVYIHNPYDQYNKITRVEARFYSTEIKKSGCCLVYVPYFLSGYSDGFGSMKDYILVSGVKNSDYVILQSDTLKAAYRSFGINPEKLIVTGSPKIDAVLKNTAPLMDEKWLRRTGGKKVILLNTSLANILKYENWLALVKKIIQRIIADRELYFIWRPHPLLTATVESITPWNQKTYQEIKEIIELSENAEYDFEDNAFCSMARSDAMISDYSSLILQYTFTGKPALVLNGKSNDRSKTVYCDYFSNYFYLDGVTISEFIQMVKEGVDEKKMERMESARQSIANPDGTCGVKTHYTILNKLLIGERDERD